MSEAFLAEGMKVVLSDRDEDSLDAQVERLAGAGAPVSGKVCDVPDPDAVAARGHRYERLDQLAMEHLLGVRA